MAELDQEGWEGDDTVRCTIVLPGDLAERLAAEPGRRGISLSELLAEYAELGLRWGPIAPQLPDPGDVESPASP